MSIGTPCFLYPVRFSASSYDLVINHGGMNETISITVETGRDYWFSGDSTADDSNGNGDLVKLLEDALNSATMVGQSFTVELSSQNVITVTGAMIFSLLWDDAGTTLDGSIFGSDGSPTAADLSTVFPKVTSGIWSPGFPPWNDSRDQQPITGALSRSVSGLVRGSFFGLPNKERDLMFDMVNREKTLEEFRETTETHGTIEDLWIRAGCLGRRVRYYPDEADRDAFSAYRFRDSEHPFERSSIDPFRWTTSLRLVLESAATTSSSGDGDGDGDGDGGSSIPSNIIAGGNLAHWWKFSEGSTSSATDFGLNASSTDMSITGATSIAGGGPTALGNPDSILFNGSTGLAEVNARAAFADTPIGTLFGTNEFSVSWWMKDAASYSNWATWIACLGDVSWLSGWGLYYYYYNFWAWQDAHSSGGYFGSFSGANTWRHYALVFDASNAVWGMSIDGTSTGTINATVDTSLGAASENAYLTVGGIRDPSGFAGSWTACEVCDLRLYSTVLTASEITSIAGGDW